MIPHLTINENYVRKIWKGPDINYVIKRCSEGKLDDGTPVHFCDVSWLGHANGEGVFNEEKKIVEHLVDYGYCDTEDALIKYLKQWNESEKEYFVEICLLDMNNEKYYKYGSYINKDGVDTEEDYYPWIEQNPDYKVEQEYKDRWIGVAISQIE